MKLKHLNEWLSFGANLGVLVGIIFLIIELQQTNRIARVSAEYELRNNFSSLNELHMMDPDYADFITYTSSDNAVIEGADAFRVEQGINRLLNIWLAGIFSYENGIASEMIYNNIIDDARAVIENNSPAARVLWRKQLDTYPSLESTELFQYIYGLLESYDELGREL